MKILFFESKKQPILSIRLTLDRMGHETGTYATPIELIGGYEDEEKQLEVFLKNNKFDFVISNLFSPYVAQLTYELEIKYAVYGMDSPMYETYMSIFSRYDNCYLFYFDKKEYRLLKEKGYTNVYYLPLAADVEWSNKLVITDEEIKKYGCNVSFVGSLYSNNLYDQYIDRFPPQVQQLFSYIMEQSAFKWDGKDRLGELLTPELISLVKSVYPDIKNKPDELPYEYYFKAFFLPES